MPRDHIVADRRQGQPDPAENKPLDVAPLITAR